MQFDQSKCNFMFVRGLRPTGQGPKVKGQVKFVMGMLDCAPLNIVSDV